MVVIPRALMLILIVFTFVGTKLSDLYVLCVHKESVAHYEVLNLVDSLETALTKEEIHINFENFFDVKKTDMKLYALLPLFLNAPVKTESFYYKPLTKRVFIREPSNKTVKLLI
ncbi:hypothetical protein [Aquifex sp.]